MKKFIFLLFSIFMIVPTVVGAHTSLSSSNPSEGQVVTEDIQQIILDFATSIEELSTMKLVKDGSEIPLEGVKVENRQLVGTIPNPSENGTYTIQWNIVGEDGHPIKGEIHFSVQKASNTEAPDNDQGSQENDQQTNQAEQNDDNQEIANDAENDNSSSTFLLTIAFGLIVIFGIVLLMFSGKKKK